MKKKLIWWILLWNWSSTLASIEIDKWTPVPVLESEVTSSNPEKGGAKSELTCSLEASQKDKELWCLHQDQCLLMEVKRVASWNDSLLWNDSTVVECKTKYQNVCVLNDQIFQLGDKTTQDDDQCSGDRFYPYDFK